MAAMAILWRVQPDTSLLFNFIYQKLDVSLVTAAVQVHKLLRASWRIALTLASACEKFCLMAFIHASYSGSPKTRKEELPTHGALPAAAKAAPRERFLSFACIAVLILREQLPDQ